MLDVHQNVEDNEKRKGSYKNIQTEILKMKDIGLKNTLTWY